MRRASGGIPLLALGAADTVAAGAAAFVVAMLSAYNSENILRLHMAGRWYSAPSHASETVGAQASAAGALRDLAVIAQNCATIASAGGGIPPLIALLSSPSVDLHIFSAVAIRNVSSREQKRDRVGWPVGFRRCWRRRS